MIAKVAFLCAAFAAVHASGIIGAPLINTGISASSRQQDGDGYGNRKGSYTITDIDGRARRVDYVADGHGFRATVKTNEPGTAASAPAAALVNSPYAGPVAPVVNHVAPAAIAAPAWHSPQPQPLVTVILVSVPSHPQWLTAVLLDMEPPLDWDTEQAFWVPESVKSSDLRKHNCI
ncbi:adult-specific rigid cuticular protein 15.7 [Caerostris extrusa]|uniref:Adult-specific rigid cuticular protein 15.7 n=1 Tax=Caerostris extrusa TaxID=172846 RepID=A0AAV4TTE5_CAEEX|nr:adult-specific rigid cuticular protein 15.7 [Caerostris extrusa]